MKNFFAICSSLSRSLTAQRFMLFFLVTLTFNLKIVNICSAQNLSDYPGVVPLEHIRPEASDLQYPWPNIDKGEVLSSIELLDLQESGIDISKLDPVASDLWPVTEEGKSLKAIQQLEEKIFDKYIRPFVVANQDYQQNKQWAQYFDLLQKSSGRRDSQYFDLQRVEYEAPVISRAGNFRLAFLSVGES